MLQLATGADRDAVNELARQIHGLHTAGCPEIFCETTELYPQERFDTHVKNRELYVAKVDGQVVGYALLPIRGQNHQGMYPQRRMILEEFCVHQALRGRGIGTDMMRDVKALAKAFRCTEMMLKVYPQNEDAIRFYEANGFLIRAIDMGQKL